jgi:hypothetical protein
MTRRKGELTGGTINREWSHQVALPADQVMVTNPKVIEDFCRDLSLCPQGNTFRRDDRDHVVFCFADPAHAERFRERFGGERFAPRERTRRGHRGRRL